ncbi:MAG: hypothetical protein A2W03_17040 [Candidatus Aminicenantes bacterium RBG_16_63_16]|nr:MAG: hypothetical protein A2W03_17040 [Candidatus Aminicenantes bacterium RBG_16_63_16]
MARLAFDLAVLGGGEAGIAVGDLLGWVMLSLTAILEAAAAGGNAPGKTRSSTRRSSPAPSATIRGFPKDSRERWPMPCAGGPQTSG